MPKPKKEINKPLPIWSVTVTAFATVIVSAETEEEAAERAVVSLHVSDMNIDESTVAPVEAKDLSGHLRHADAVDYDLEEALSFACKNLSKDIPEKLLPKK